MAKYRNNLPQLSGNFFVTNGGLETTLIYHEHIDIPCFASFDVLKNQTGCVWMKNYLCKFVDIAKKYHVGCILENASWRAHSDWMDRIGYSNEDFIYFNKKSIEILEDVRNEYAKDNLEIVLNASVGPRSDGYKSSLIMTPEQSDEYHSKQIEILSKTNIDMITGLTLNYPDEAIGIVRAAKRYQMPVIISFTVETDGKLTNGQSLKEAIQLVDKETSNGPEYYMINCSHPTHFINSLIPDEDWTLRIRGVKGNASKKSHAELDNSTDLDEGNPMEFAEDNKKLLSKLKNLNIFGGCCGTDTRHLEKICQTCIDTFNQNKQK